jgi:zinc/manganese transport system permease protein
LLLSVIIALAVTWVGLALAYFTNDPVGFFITTLGFGLYLLTRGVRAVRDSRPVRRLRPVAVPAG